MTVSNPVVSLVCYRARSEERFALSDLGTKWVGSNWVRGDEYWVTLVRPGVHDSHALVRALSERVDRPTVVAARVEVGGRLLLHVPRGRVAELIYPTNGAGRWEGDLSPWSTAFPSDSARDPRALVTSDFLGDSQSVLEVFGVGLTLPAQVGLPDTGFALADSSVGRGVRRIGGHDHDFLRGRYVMGRGRDAGQEFLGIWDRRAPEAPLERFGLKDEREAHARLHLLQGAADDS